MKPSTPTRSLDDTVTEAALLWLRRRIAAQGLLNKPYTLQMLAEEMAQFFDPGDPPKEWSTVVDSVKQTVSRYLGISAKGKATWRIDYLDAFCRAMDLPVAEFLSPSAQLGRADIEFIEYVTRDVEWIRPRGRREGKSSQNDLDG